MFRLFQEVLNAPPSPHAQELRKLAVYMVRQFVAATEKNPKIYAELFFWKTMRECNDMENGYEGSSGGGGGGKGKGWSEEQEDELRRLFEENQANPQNEKGNQGAGHRLMTVAGGESPRGDALSLVFVVINDGDHYYCLHFEMATTAH